MKCPEFNKLILVVISMIFLSSCATDESLFDNNLANDQFQWMIMDDGVTEDHIMEGVPLTPNLDSNPHQNLPRNQ